MRSKADIYLLCGLIDADLLADGLAFGNAGTKKLPSFLVAPVEELIPASVASRRSASLSQHPSALPSILRHV